MKVKLFHANAKIPEKKREGDAGWDIYLPTDATFAPQAITAVPLGFGVKIPDGWAGLLAMRSSICKTGLAIQMPLIDSNYVGEIHLLAYNPTDRPISFKEGERVCSLFVFPVLGEPLELVSELPRTNRGSNWSGSSGK